MNLIVLQVVGFEVGYLGRGLSPTGFGSNGSFDMGGSFEHGGVRLSAAAAARVRGIAPPAHANDVQCGIRWFPAGAAAPFEER